MSTSFPGAPPRQGRCRLAPWGAKCPERKRLGGRRAIGRQAGRMWWISTAAAGACRKLRPSAANVGPCGACRGTRRGVAIIGTSWPTPSRETDDSSASGAIHDNRLRSRCRSPAAMTAACTEPGPRPLRSKARTSAARPSKCSTVHELPLAMRPPACVSFSGGSSAAARSAARGPRERRAHRPEVRSGRWGSRPWR